MLTKQRTRPNNVRQFPTRPQVDVSVTMPDSAVTRDDEPNYLALWGGVIAIACIATGLLSFNISQRLFNQKYDSIIRENVQLQAEKQAMQAAKQAYCSAP